MNHLCHTAWWLGIDHPLDEQATLGRAPNTLAAILESSLLGASLRPCSEEMTESLARCVLRTFSGNCGKRHRDRQRYRRECSHHSCSSSHMHLLSNLRQPMDLGSRSLPAGISASPKIMAVARRRLPLICQTPTTQLRRGGSVQATEELGEFISVGDSKLLVDVR